MKRKKMIFTVSLFVPARDETNVAEIQMRMNAALGPVCEELVDSDEDDELCYAVAEYQHTNEGILS